MPKRKTIRAIGLKMKHLDICSGIGGFALAARWAAIETIGFAEVDLFCCKVLEKNFPGVKNYGDIKQDIEWPKADLITAGFPCQPFSQAGKKEGVKDERYLWPEIVRVMEHVKPGWAIFENVYYLLQMGVKDMLIDLERIGYKYALFVLPAAASNAPHRRDRLWIIAYSNSLRSDDWINSGESRYIQENIDRHVAQVQSQWAQLKPNTWSTYTARDWLDYNTRACRGNDGLSTRVYRDRIKALGNAIVPQVIYPVLQLIKDLHG